MKVYTWFVIFLYLLPGISVSLPGQGIIIPPGIYMTLYEGNLLICQNWTNHGTFTQEDGMVWFAGTWQQLKGSTAQLFKNVTIKEGSFTTIVAHNQSLSEVLLCNGYHNAAGKLTLLSDSNQTALIDGSGTGTVAGDLTMQRYLPSGFGYKYFSSPFQTSTVNEFSDDMDLGAAFPTFYKYDESLLSSGWINYTDPGGILIPLAGYAVNFGPVAGPTTADVSGTVNNEDIGPLFLYNNNTPYTLGFNLTGNPYPSPIDWDAANGWTRTNIDDAIYYFDAGTTNQYTGTYSTYINGISSNGIANNIISSLQGFFIHVTDGVYPVEATLQLSNEVRINNLSTGFHKSLHEENMPLVRLTAQFSRSEEIPDPTVIYFNNQANRTFDSKFDALKLMNTDTLVPSLYTMSKEGRRLSINCLPDPSDSILTIPVGISTLQDGLITLGAADIINISPGIYIYFNDALYLNLYDLKEGPDIFVNLAEGNHENRFSLIFSRNEILSPIGIKDPFTVYYSGLNIHIHVSLNETGEFSLYTMIGQKVISLPILETGHHTIPVTVCPGIYVATFSCSEGVFSKKIYINNQ